MTLLVFGMDGAVREYLDEAIERGMMPNTEKFIEEGCFGDMGSTVPPVTLPAWVSMFSGLDPSRFDTAHATSLDREYNITVKNSKDWKGKLLWDKIDGEFGLINVPGTSPLWPVNGYVIEGFPNVENPEIYPESLAEKLEVPDFKETGIQPTKEGKRQAYLENFEKRRPWFSQVKEECDVRIEVFQLTDTNAHRSKNLDQVLEAYSKVDEVLGERMEEYDNIMFVSDHGFQHIDNYFYTNAWLREKGYLIEKENDKSFKWRERVQKLFTPLAETFLRPVLKYVNDQLSSHTGVDFAPKAGFLDGIDFERTKAFSYLKSTSNFGDININDSRWSKGPVDETERQELKEGIKSELEKEYFVEKVWLREELYEDPEGMPDILFETREGVAAGPPLFPKYLFETDAFVHSRTGVVGGWGPIFSTGELEKKNIVDVAPTLAYYLGQDLDCDGEVMLDVFSDDFDPVDVSSREVENIDF